MRKEKLTLISLLFSLTLVVLTGSYNKVFSCFSSPTGKWEGTVDSDWNNAANWENAAVPSNISIEIDPSNYVNAPVISSNSSFGVRALTVKNGGSLVVSANLTLSRGMTVEDAGSSVTITGGILDLSARDLDIDDATLTVNAGTLRVRDLDLQSGNSVCDYNGGTIDVLRDVKVDDGNLSIGASSLSGVGGNNDFDMNGGNGLVQIEGNNTFPGGFENVKTNDGRIEYNGIDQIIDCSFSYNDLIVSGTGLKTLNNNLTVDGDLRVDSELDVTSANFVMDLSGDLLINGTLNLQQGLVRFSGSSTQNVNPQSNVTFYDIEIDMSSDVSLNIMDYELKGTLYLTNGELRTNDRLTLVSDVNGTARINEITGGTITGKITMQRYIPTGTYGWRFLGTAVNGTILADWNDDMITTGYPGSDYPGFSFTSVYFYDESVPGDQDLGFIAPASANVPLNPGVGTWVYASSNDGTDAPYVLDVKGAPVTGDVDFNASYTSSGAPLDDGWLLVANPYASSIDWDAAGWTKSNMNNAVYIWNPDQEHYASYVGGIGINGGSSVITSSQGFYVQANAANPVLIASESVKTVNDPGILRSLNEQAGLMISLNGNGYSDQTVIRRNEYASNEFDGAFDAVKIRANGLVPNLFSLSGANEYSINTLEVEDVNQAIPLNLNVGVNGTYTLNFAGDDQYASCLLLEDKSTGEMIDVREEKSYSFQINTGDNEDRFVLHMGAKLKPLVSNITCNGVQDGAVELKASGNGPYSFVLKDISGAVVQQRNVLHNTYKMEGLQAGIYRAEVSASNGDVCGSRQVEVLITEPKALSVEPLVEAVSQLGMQDGNILLGLSGGSGSYQVVWEDDCTDEDRYGLEPGDYAVTITDERNCSVSKSFHLEAPEGIEEEENAASLFSAYRTESGKALVSYHGIESQKARVKLLDLNGKTISKHNVEFNLKGQLELDLPEVNGLYIIELRNSELSEVIRL